MDFSKKQSFAEFKWENVREFILFSSIFVMTSFIIANVIDNIMNKVYKWIEKRFIYNPESTPWLVTQVLIQLLMSSALTFYVRYMISSYMIKYSTDQTIYHPKMFSILFAFINFYGQDNMKTKLTELNKRIDNLFS